MASHPAILVLLAASWLLSEQQAAPMSLAADQPTQASNQVAELAEQVPIYMQHTTTVLVILHVSVFITGLVGNALVCLSVYRNKSLQTVTNYYIVNLALADFLVILICLPPTVYWDLTLTWNFGLVLCKLVLYLQTISVSVSVLTLTCISIDRWYAICRPLRFSSTKGRAKITIALIWLLSMAFASPDAIYLTTRPMYEEEAQVYMDCTYSWPESSTRLYQLCIVSLLFVGPFVLMSISYWHIVGVLWRDQTVAESMQQSLCNQPQAWSSLELAAPAAASGRQSAGAASQVSCKPPVAMQVNRCGQVEVAAADEQTNSINGAASGARPTPASQPAVRSSGGQQRCQPACQRRRPSPAGGSHVGGRRRRLRRLLGRLRGRPPSEGADERLGRSSRRYRRNLANYAASGLGAARQRRPPACSCASDSLTEQPAPQLLAHQDKSGKVSCGQANSARFCRLIESRKKAAKMLIVIVIMFGLCYLPVHFLNTLRYTIGLPQNNITTIASLVSHWLCYFNSAVNPLIYNLMSGKFRHEFANLFFCRCFRGPAS